MATEKRQRQDALRAEKLKAQQAVEAKVAKQAKLKKWAWIGVPAVLLIVLALWKPWDSGSSSTAVDTSTSTSTGSVVPSTGPSTSAPPNTASKELSTKPTVTVPDGEPPKELQINDLVVGTGPEIVKGSTALVQYTGKSWSTKKQFDSSWDRGAQPFLVQTVGSGSVIAGWDEGLIGAKQGGRRQIIIPPAKGYGASGSGADIGPNETLVFVVDIVNVGAPAGSAASTPDTTTAK